MLSILLAGMGLVACATEYPSPRLQIQVMAAAPVAGARVLIWWVDEHGHPLRRDSSRSGSAALVVGNALDMGYTDEEGVVELETGPAYGLLVLVAQGGQTTDPWIDDAEPDEDEPASIDLDIELVSALVDFFPGGPQPRQAVISPLTTVAAVLGEHRLAHPRKEETYMEAMRRAYDLLGDHLGDIELTAGPVPAADQPLFTLDMPARHALALRALPSLAHRIARTSSISGRSFHTLHLLAALLEDAADDRALLDGAGPEGPITVGGCPAREDCAGGDACRTVCDLGANTLRSDLASALAFDFLPSAHNLTSMTMEDVRPLIVHLQTSAESELFGSDPGAPLDGPRPTIEVRGSLVFDERQDTVGFDANAEPMHTPGEAAEVDLGQADACPTVGKHTHRLDDPGDNPLRWEVVVSDRSGWASDGEPATALGFRVRRRPPPPEPELAEITACDVSGEGEWLTDWLDAHPMASAAGGTVYEAILLREDLPELVTGPAGRFDVVFRGLDALGQEVMTCRCWEHVPLAAPLQVTSAGQVLGPESLHAANLEPGNNLAPLLNGVPLEQGRGIMEFTLRNGTTEPVYTTLTIEQSVATYVKSWQKANAPLGLFYGETDCLDTGDCSLGFPPDRRTMFVNDEHGVIDELVSGLLIRDLTTGDRIEPCVDCDPDEYLIGPRLAPSAPREYRVMLVTTDLGALAPEPLGAAPQLFLDESLDAELPIPITGRAIGRVRKCVMAVANDAGKCTGDEEFAHYIALTSGSVTLDMLKVTARIRPHHAMPSRVPGPGIATLDVPVQLDGPYVWATNEVTLPEPPPND